MTSSVPRTPAHKTDLVTNGIPPSEIPGLYTSENYTLEDVEARVREDTPASYTHDEIFGQFCHTAQYIHCPVDMAFEYAANVYCLEEFTFSVRNLHYIGGGLYKGTEVLAKDTSIYMHIDAYPDCRVVDHLCAWDQGNELWMRYHFRFLDAMLTIRRPGTVVFWSNCRHAYYDRETKNVPPYIAEPRARTDRAWIGDIWPAFPAIHHIEVTNMKKILEYRFGHG